MSHERSLLPIATGSGQLPPHEQAVLHPHRKGAAQQDDHFTLLVGLGMKWLGVVGTATEVGTSIVALYDAFMTHPGPIPSQPVVIAALSAFIALVVETGQFLLVVNLNDPFQHIFDGHPLEAFVTEGEFNLQLALRWGFIIGCVGLNVWWNYLFFSAITTEGWLISLGMFVLFFASVLMWPLGIKMVRHSKRRIHAAQRVAVHLKEADDIERSRNAVNVTPVVVESNNATPGLIRWSHRR
jgi:hypothetical protein